MKPEEIRKAIDERAPVVYEGKVYPCITAYIYRMIRDPYNGRYHPILQVELLSKSNVNSVLIVDPRKVELADKETNNE